MYKKVNDVKLDGFAVTSAAPGETVKVQVKDWATSESPLFYVYAEQIANLIFPKLRILNFRDVVNCYLVVIHPDNTAYIYYAQGFKVVAKTKIKPNRSIKAGEPVYAKDIEGIAEVRFPDISINSDDRVIFLQRKGWRFGIFFDFTKEINLDTLASDIAKLEEHLVLEDVLKNTLAEIRSKETQAEFESEGEPEDIYEAFIITEGKTDRIHLEKAFKKIDYGRKLEYSKAEKDLGDEGLLEICHRAIHLQPYKIPLICIFDRDNPKIKKELIGQSGGVETEYQSWGNNIFSMMLPQPEDRKDYENISVEMYYPDEVIKRTTNDGKRLFFDNELKMEILPGKVKKMIAIPPTPKHELSKKIYSTDVESIEDSLGRKVGISKTAFAELISAEQNPFKEVDFENFRYISDLIEKVIVSHTTSDS